MEVLCDMIDVIFSMTPQEGLIKSVETGRLFWVKYFLDQGLDVNTEKINPFGHNPLLRLIEIAIIKGYVDVLRLLIERGATADPPTLFLHVSNIDIIKVLLEKFRLPSDIYLRPSYVKAVRSGNLPLVKFFTDMRPTQGRSPDNMQHALSSGSFPMIQFFLDRGFVIKSISIGTYERAIKNNDEKMVQFLLDNSSPEMLSTPPAGMPIDRRQSMMLYAITNKNIPMIKLLLQRLYDITI